MENRSDNYWDWSQFGCRLGRADYGGLDMLNVFANKREKKTLRLGTRYIGRWFRDAHTDARMNEHNKNSMPLAKLRWAEAQKINTQRLKKQRN